MKLLHAVVAIKTTNPNNGSQGFSRNRTFAKARERKAQRKLVADQLRLRCRWGVNEARVLLDADPSPEMLQITVTRIAPSRGLDPHDGLGAALKGPIDGCADALGLKDDRDPRVKWITTQMRGRPREYAVAITVEIDA